MVKNRDQWEVIGIHRGGALTVSGPTGTARMPGEYVDLAAAHIVQHREAFAILNDYETLGSRCHSWDDSAFALSQRAASKACDALDRTLGRGLAIEPPGLELGL